MTKFLPVHKLSARIKPNSSLVCDLSAMNEAERARYAYLSKDVFANAQNVRPLVRGYSFHLRNDADVLRKLAEWIPLEQSCCPFLQFQVNIARRETPIILNVTGPRGTAEFIRQELGGRELGLAE